VRQKKNVLSPPFSAASCSPLMGRKHGSVHGNLSPMFSGCNQRFIYLFYLRNSKIKHPQAKNTLLYIKQQHWFGELLLSTSLKQNIECCF